MNEPLRFVFGVHLHQPVGNFDRVFDQHLREVYRPFLAHAERAGFLPLTLHVSGPLLEWLDAHDPAFLDLLARLAGGGRLELLLAGFDEPILAALPRADRIGQIAAMREFLRRRLGAEASGLWLTERVWEPELAADLADAGVGYALVDDRHFLVSGFARDALHRPWRTESDGRGLGLLAIDERLRYLVPFRPPEESAAYLRSLRAAGHPLAVLADDGEKFGGWPGTLEWVYTKGWLDRFFGAMRELIDGGEVRLVSGAEAVREVPCAGLAYLPTASYREMEQWSLPPRPQARLAAIETDLGPGRLAGPDGALVRGSHWRNFLVRYTESNRMHKTMVALSALCRERGDPAAARRAVSRAQCNDAYWHGVFGGLYLPVLRRAVWRQLAIAERELRQGQALACESRDLDGDGHDELWVHSARFSALVSPRRGGAVETLVRFAGELNLADALTRRREAYHEAAVATAAAAAAAAAAGHGEDGAPSIHEIEKAARLAELPPEDLDDRAILVDRVLPAGLANDDYERARYTPLASWARTAMRAEVRAEAGAVTIVMTGGGLEKSLSFDADGRLTAVWRWDAGAFPEGAVFAPELSLAKEAPLATVPAADVWRYDIRTVSKSERGLEETVQGVSFTPRWPASLGAATLTIDIG